MPHKVSTSPRIGDGRRGLVEPRLWNKTPPRSQPTLTWRKTDDAFPAPKGEPSAVLALWRGCTGGTRLFQETARGTAVGGEGAAEWPWAQSTAQALAHRTEGPLSRKGLYLITPSDPQSLLTFLLVSQRVFCKHARQHYKLLRDELK